MTNGELELHNTLIAILMELQKINRHLACKSENYVRMEVNHD